MNAPSDFPLVDKWWLDRPLTPRCSTSDRPRITVVVPSFNYARYLEDCLRSVLSQDYPHREVILLDGGSQDGSRTILEKYAEHLDYWRSAPDGGQTAAINEGFARSTGEIFVWLNADDAYASPTVLSEVAAQYEAGFRWIAGEWTPMDDVGHHLPKYQDWGVSHPVDFRGLLHYWRQPCPPQPAVFIARELGKKAFPLSEHIHYIMDYQYFLRVLAQEPKAAWLKSRWVYFRFHGANKSIEGTPAARAAIRAEYDAVFSSAAALLPAEEQNHYLTELRHLRSAEVAQKDPWLVVGRQIVKDPGMLLRRQTWAAFWRRYKFRGERGLPRVADSSRTEQSFFHQS